MSTKESKIQQICTCLSNLTNGIRDGESTDIRRTHSNVKTTFTDELRENVHSTFQKIEEYPIVKTFVTELIQPCFGNQCTTCSYLKFFQLCLVLLRLLKTALTEEEMQSGSEKNDILNAPVPKALLSISQQTILKKSLQFVVALGILPNLLRGIGVPLSKRLKHAKILENFTSSCSFYQKHIQITVCLETLITCLECSAMQSSILSYHGSDILAAFLQLCYAPIKKVDISEESSAKPVPIGIESMSFKVMINSVEDSSQYSEAQMLSVMLAHRNYFIPYMEKFLRQISHSLLMWELLIFQGIPIKSNESDVAIVKPPVWLSKICNQMLTDLILQNHGIADLVQVVLDKAYDADVQTGKVDKVRIEAVARLITYNPLRHISLNNYIQRLCKQVFHLLHLKGSMMDGLLKHVASCIILQFCERDMKSAEQYFFEELLNPLMDCVRIPANLSKDVLISENKLTTSIEDLHQIFVVSSNPLSQKYTKLLFPFLHCLCEMYFFLLKGKSYLKSKVKDLITTIFKNSSDEDVLSVFTTVSFLNNKNCGLYIAKVSFANGDEGGIVAVPKVEEDFAGETIRFHAILEILGELQNKNLIRSYILHVLKEFCAFHLESEEDLTNPESLKTGVVFNILLQELSEWNIDIGEALMTNISEVIDILMTLLSNTLTSNKDSAFYEKIVWAIVMILSSIFDSIDKLTSSDWTSLKKCLPIFEKLQKSDIDYNLKEIAFTIMALISTHGIAGKNDLDYMKEFQKCSISPSANAEMPELDKSSPNNRASTYRLCIKDIRSDLVHIKGHGLISLVNLLKERDDETVQNKKELLETLMKCLEDEDSYVFLPTIQALSELALIDSELVVPFIINKYQTCEEKAIVLKLGEVLLKICNALGDSSLFLYKDMLLHTFLIGTKKDDPQIRASSLSNLGQVCMCMKFQITGHWVQEILNCVLSYLNTDPDLEVRRCAVMVVYLLLKGVDKDMLKVLENEVKTIYTRLRILYDGETDDVTRLHSQLALEEINEIMKKLLTPKIEMIKEIRILR
ncbi:Transport and Golgi organization protein 6 like protein [Argiope bruennichi]|uniref:Transport and Golgi organization protein 6 like protein n=1 Tax=Argiope bruennichi TaxID=94029 RepID=A0A8T0E6L5_ARGBR|nr:Transport and Golgi organization protein 6 like protein [Argiope bruennichi]